LVGETAQRFLHPRWGNTLDVGQREEGVDQMANASTHPLGRALAIALVLAAATVLHVSDATAGRL
jgi:hypothetical protein